VLGSAVLKVASVAGDARVENRGKARNCLMGRRLRLLGRDFQFRGRTSKCITFGGACNPTNPFIIIGLIQCRPTKWLPSPGHNGYYRTLS
jgi:hypothetical protein